MKFPSRWFVTFLTVLADASFSSLTEASPADANNDEDICTVYLAPSSIPNAGYGLFTTKSYKEEEEIFDGRSPSVMILDFELHMPELPNWPIFDYIWLAYGAGNYEALEANTWEPTPLGSLANYHSYLANYAHSGNPQRYDDTMASRFADPEAGAFSYHSSFPMLASRDIAAGEELFADYGDAYLDHRTEDDNDEDIYGFIPREDDYDQAALIARMLSTLDSTPQEATKAIQTVVGGLKNERVAALLPKDPSDYAKFRDMALEEIGFEMAWQTVEPRSIDWIVQNGKCLDNRFEVRQSTIPKAGLGAFANRRIAKGEIIIPATLIHVADKESLNIYDRTINPETTEEEKPIGKQLLMNYCFGHGESSVLLCPTTQAAAMNHCSTRTTSKGQCSSKHGANAGYRWPEDWSPETKDWLKLSFEELNERHGRGLVLEIYATRDIEVGDEIFLDYGTGWEEAWERHVHTWSPPDEDSIFASYASIKELNDNMEPPRTDAELADNPLPDNVVTGCIYMDKYFEEGFDCSTLSDKEILKHYAVDGSDFIWEENHVFPKFWPCSIISGNDRDGYTVQIHQAPYEDDTLWTEKDLPMFISNYPRESIRYFNVLGLSDQHLPNSFRHHPELPDDIFPDQWKNLREENGSTTEASDDNDTEKDVSTTKYNNRIHHYTRQATG